MFNPLAWLDGLLLGAAQRLCDKTQRLFGLTKFRLQKWALIVSTVFYCGFYVFDQRPVIAVLLSIYIAGSLFLVRIIEMQESEFLKNGGLVMPPFGVLQRIFWFSAYLILALPGLSSENYGDRLLSYGLLCYVLFIYLSDCIPRPPSKSKMREWSEKALTWLNDLLASPPVPVPNK